MRYALATLFLLICQPVAGQQHHSNPWLKTWIEPVCCVTNDCCWEITESEVSPLDGLKWRIRSTGQVVNRRDFSPDGKFYRCACDQSVDSGVVKWIRHQGANTRCLFVPMRAF